MVIVATRRKKMRFVKFTLCSALVLFSLLFAGPGFAQHEGPPGDGHVHHGERWVPRRVALTAPGCRAIGLQFTGRAIVMNGYPDIGGMASGSTATGGSGADG